MSPRKRAQTTFELLFGELGEDSLIEEKRITTTNDIEEWDYGDYEGLLTKQIRERRREKGLDHERPWDIWRDGCEGGELVRSCSCAMLVTDEKKVRTTGHRAPGQTHRSDTESSRTPYVRREPC